MSEIISLAKGSTGGLDLPADVIVLACELERRDLILKADGDKLRISQVDGGKPDLSPEDADRIRKWKPHLLSLIRYVGPETTNPA